MVKFVNRRSPGAVLLFLVSLTVLLLFNPARLYADVVYTNPESGYSVVISDEAGLLTDAEIRSLKEIMQPITNYCSVAFATTDTNTYGSTSRLAEAFTDANFSDSTGTVFLIDMAQREIYIDTTGSARRTLTSAYARTITDNVYTYASDGNYYDCAASAYRQMYTLLEGGRIAQPMKYISNALLALVLAALINYLIVKRTSRRQMPSTSQLMEGIFSKFELRNGRADFINQTKRYSPQQTSGSGGGSRGGGGGGGGGGHSGGGHSF